MTRNKKSRARRGGGDPPDMSIKYTVTAEKTYTFHSKTGIGKWNDTGRDIYVKTGCSKSQCENALKISHPNLLSCFFVNEELGHIIFEYKKTLLSDFINQWEREGNGRVMSIKLPCKKPLGHWKTYHYLSNVLRHICSQLYTFMSDIHSKDLYIKEFKLTDLRMSYDNVVVFCGVLDSTSPWNINKTEDYKRLAAVLRELIGVENVKKLPALKHLFDLVVSDKLIFRSNPAVEKMLSDHLSIASVSYVDTFLKRCSESIKLKTFGHAVALRNVRTVQEYWELKFLKDEKFLAVIECYNYEGRTYVQKGEESKKSLIDFARNLNEHLLQSLKAIGHLGPAMEKEQVHAIVIGLFTDELVGIQLELYKYADIPQLMGQ